LRGRALAAALAVAFLLRAAWPLADPAPRLSWSNGPYTDPAWIVLGARDAHVLGSWDATGAKGHAFFPLWNGLVWALWSVTGPSRLSLQLLGALVATAAVAAGALAARRAGLPPARAAWLLGGTAWLALFGRVPLTEHLATALLALAAAAALGKSRGAARLAGFLAAAAALFGKPHAALFLPALLGFHVVRAGSVRALLDPALGVAGAAALWAATVLPWAADAIRDQLAAGDLYRGPDGGPVALLLAPWRALRDAWVAHRIPVLGALGGTFALGALLLPGPRGRAHADGTALFAWWAACAWIGTALLPYDAPRYFLPAVFALVLAAVAALGAIGRGGFEVRPPRGAGERAVVFLGLLVAAVAALESVAQAIGALADGVLLPGDPGYGAMTAVRDFWERTFREFPRILGLAALGAAVGTALAGTVAGFLRRRAPRPGPRVVALLLIVVVTVQALQLGAAAGGRTRALEDARESVDALLGPDAVLFGTFAPALVLGSERRGVPRFGPFRSGDLARHGITHVALAAPGEVLEAERAGLPLTPILGASLRSRHLRAVRILRVPGTDALSPPGPYETAVGALGVGDVESAAGALDAILFADLPPAPAADVLALRARLAFLRGDEATARHRLEESLRLRPGSPDNWYNLGRLRERVGDAAGAGEAWRHGLRLDPADADLHAAWTAWLRGSVASESGI
jgi:hypothetical protein